MSPQFFVFLHSRFYTIFSGTPHYIVHLNTPIRPVRRRSYQAILFNSAQFAPSRLIILFMTVHRIEHYSGSLIGSQKKLSFDSPNKFNLFFSYFIRSKKFLNPTLYRLCPCILAVRLVVDLMHLIFAREFIFSLCLLAQQTGCKSLILYSV